MALSSAYVLPVNRIPDLFKRIRDGQAPDQLTNRLLTDWGFSSTNDRAFIGLLKSIGFLTQDGKPTQRYNDYRDHSKSKVVMADALREAYSDLFLITARPTDTDKDSIEGKFKSFHNSSDNNASLMRKTFYALLALADLSGERIKPEEPLEKVPPAKGGNSGGGGNQAFPGGLHYNIQIHLPASKDTEVYNAIFKSLREHLLVQ